MWSNNNDKIIILPPCKGFLTPPPPSILKPSYSSSMTECRRRQPTNRGEPFHVIHKVPSGDSPYVKAKQVQVRYISTFFVYIFSGFHLDSCLKLLNFF